MTYPMALNKRRTRKELIQELEKNYLLQPACSKLGLTRSTVYRWMKEDQEFDQAVRLAQSMGRRYMSDYTESKLFKNIESQNQRSIEFWLKNNNEHYKSRDRAADKIIESLSQQLKESRSALSAVGSRNLYFDFIDVEKVMNYLESPEVMETKALRQGIYSGHSVHEKELLAQMRKLLVQMKIAEYAEGAGLLPEESDELAD